MKNCQTKQTQPQKPYPWVFETFRPPDSTAPDHLADKPHIHNGVVYIKKYRITVDKT